MTKVLHISTECYPAAKAGGMGDVVGALPNYLPAQGVEAAVIIPKYATKWIKTQKWKTIQKFSLKLGKVTRSVKIQKLKGDSLTFDLYVIDIPELFYRDSVYLNEEGEAFSDETERYIAFQRSVLDWLLIENDFDLLHCHDHMTGLITFMIKYCPKYEPIKHLPTFFTIHNGQYRGIMSWEAKVLLPPFDEKDEGVPDWDGNINGLATAIKCCHMYTTVSPSYLKEIQDNSDTLTPLFQQEGYKSAGIINGIDDQMWAPKTDSMIDYTLKSSVSHFKLQNKKALAEQYDFSPKRNLVGFIGRFAHQKGADLLAKAYDKYLSEHQEFHFFILGSGDKALEQEVLELQKKYPDNVTAVIAYNEALAHKVYASSDYLIMPSRFEPCGLNQMYAMRYGAVPIVRSTGGLIDTVPDIGDGGNGITFLKDSAGDIVHSLHRADELSNDKKALKKLLDKITKIDFSWGHSAKQYTTLYHKTLNKN